MATSSLLYHEALEQLASVDVAHLSNEAKVEHCRATRDLRGCGRNVQDVLVPCGHASLCAECGQRCDACPICRMPIPKTGARLRTRLYYKCIEAGLISKKYDDRFQDKDSAVKQLRADVQRLYSLFDVAVENNLVSLVCHYITDVCMDEGAVSSDPILAFLLDEVVVKDWCACSFEKIVEELRGIYWQGQEKMSLKTCSLMKYLSHLSGIANVLETMELSFKGAWDAQLDNIHYLFENVLRVKQHLEIMIWCIRHSFLENIPSHYQDFASWCSIMQERKSAALNRSWPNYKGTFTEEVLDHDVSTLFIEDALANLEPDRDGKLEELSFTCQQKGGECTLQFDSKIGMPERCCYPFENFQVAADVLFLHGSPDLVVAKRAIFLYYLFDRHWTVPDVHWKHLVDDFSATFGISRHSLLESLTFYLLDDHSEEALKEACCLLPEIANREMHPKVAQVLLERQQPDLALRILRCCGRDDIHAYSASQCSPIVSLGDAVVGVRVRIECGLLTEAFMYQRAYCMKMKEQKAHPGHSATVFEVSNCATWLEHMNVLVTEICHLCLRRNLADRLIECPWNSDEEKYLHKCFYESALEDPSTTMGSLLVVFYLQRYRYAEADEIHQKLHRLETEFISNIMSDEVAFRMRAAIQWRETLLDRSLELLPEVQHQHLKSGLFPNSESILPKESTLQTAAESSNEWQANSKYGNVESSILLGKDLKPLQQPSTSFTKSGLMIKPCFKISDQQSSSFLSGRHFHSNGVLFNSADKTASATDVMTVNHFTFPRFDVGNSQHFNSHEAGVMPRNYPLTSQSTPLKELNQRSLEVPHHFQLDSSSIYNEKVGVESKEPLFHAENTCPADMPDNQRRSSHIFGDLKYSFPDQTLRMSGKGKRLPTDRPWITETIQDVSTDFPWSTKSTFLDNAPMAEGLRWRSDETSDDEQDQYPGSAFPGISPVSSVKLVRKRRFKQKINEECERIYR